MSELKVFESPISPWMLEQGEADDIALSSRVRLARNFNGYVFPPHLSMELKQQILAEIKEKFDGKIFNHNYEMHMLKMDDLNILKKSLLVEKHLISPLLMKNQGCGVLISTNEQLCVMLHEEDHLRMQCMFTGIQVEKAYALANELDDWMEEKLDFAFHEKFGYLTSCATNVGTGLRCSVMLHLPGLVLTNQMELTVQTLGRLGFVVRGIYGEGRQALGHLFQLSNQITLGKTEEEMVSELTRITEKIVADERQARKYLIQHRNQEMENRVSRSLGILKYATLMDAKEAAGRLSDLLLGSYFGLIEGLSVQQIRQLFSWIQPGFLQLYAGRSLDINEREVERASLLRKYLA